MGRDSDRRQRRIEERRQRDVVEADDGHVVRAAKARVVQRAVGAECDDVAGDEYGGDRRSPQVRGQGAYAFETDHRNLVPLRELVRERDDDALRAADLERFGDLDDAHQPR